MCVHRCEFHGRCRLDRSLIERLNNTRLVKNVCGDGQGLNDVQDWTISARDRLDVRTIQHRPFKVSTGQPVTQHLQADIFRSHCLTQMGIGIQRLFQTIRFPNGMVDAGEDGIDQTGADVVPDLWGECGNSADQAQILRSKGQWALGPGK